MCYLQFHCNYLWNLLAILSENGFTTIFVSVQKQKHIHQNIV